MTSLETQAAITTIRSLVGSRAGSRELRILAAPRSYAKTWDGCPRGRNLVQVVDPDYSGDSTFVVDLDSGEIVN